MLSTRIIPCLDVTEGRVVKGVNFGSLIDAGDPVEIAKSYQDQGADELVFLDITASSDNRKIIQEVVEKTTEQCFMPVTVGGGIRSISDIRSMLHAGADKVSINTSAVLNPGLISQASNYFGNQCIVVAIDAKYTGNNKWEVYTHGGRRSTGIDVIDWSKEVFHRGAGEILLTSMDRDGTKEGFDNELISAVSSTVVLPVIASGGVGNLKHLVDGVKKGKADAVLAASIFHFGIHTIHEAKEIMKQANIPVRL